jgi:hypothetical protein
MTVPLDLLVAAVTALGSVILALSGVVVYFYRLVQKREDQMIKLALELVAEGRKDDALLVDKIRRLVAAPEDTAGNPQA